MERSTWNGLEQIVADIHPLERVDVSKGAVFGVGGWSFVLNNSARGTDLGMVPSLCARELKRCALRLTSQEGQYPATILEAYSPEAGEPLRCRRAICAAKDGGRWTFTEYGDAFPFEDVDAYRAKRIRDRFTTEMLHRYVRELDIPIAASAFEFNSSYLLRSHRAV